MCVAFDLATRRSILTLFGQAVFVDEKLCIGVLFELIMGPARGLRSVRAGKQGTEPVGDGAEISVGVSHREYALTRNLLLVGLSPLQAFDPFSFGFVCC